MMQILSFTLILALLPDCISAAAIIRKVGGKSRSGSLQVFGIDAGGQSVRQVEAGSSNQAYFDSVLVGRNISNDNEDDSNHSTLPGNSLQLDGAQPGRALVENMQERQFQGPILPQSPLRPQRPNLPQSQLPSQGTYLRQSPLPFVTQSQTPSGMQWANSPTQSSGMQPIQGTFGQGSQEGRSFVPQFRPLGNQPPGTPWAPSPTGSAGIQFRPLGNQPPGMPWAPSPTGSAGMQFRPLGNQPVSGSPFLPLQGQAGPVPGGPAGLFGPGNGKVHLPWDRPCNDRPGCNKGSPWTERVNAAAAGVQAFQDVWKDYVIIRYKFDWNIDLKRKNLFRDAITTWSSVTCIQFLEEPYAPGPFVLVAIGKEDQCSVIPMGQPDQWAPTPFVSLVNMGSCNTIGFATHEVGHVLGLHHTQTRPDAAKKYHGKGPYVTIKWQNMKAEAIRVNMQAQDLAYQFQPDEATYTGSANDGVGDPEQGYFPYDYESIMHYERTQTLETFPNGMWDNFIGSQKLSSSDIIMVLDTYRCRRK